MVLDWSQNWSRLSLFQRWRAPPTEPVDGTNNVTEQIIGQRVKERYHTRRGYKRDEAILNLSSLIGWLALKGRQSSLSEWVAN